MGAYEGVAVDQEIAELIRVMGKAEEYRERLQSLQSIWDSLTLLGHLSGTATDMSDTRTAFQQLSGSLLNQLARETLKKTTLAMKSKAQVAVDIMVRNLFERTADIGFLAMDDDVREYLGEFAPLKSRSAGEEHRLELEKRDAGLREQFREYVQKYSVYSNIMLLDTEGNVLLQLDEQNPVSRSGDALIAESLASQKAYVETFRYSDLQPKQDNSLIYSYRVTDVGGQTNLGVLCLCFRLANESERIFANLVQDEDWSVITLLDQKGSVIASSDAFHVPVGATVKFHLDRAWSVTRFAGRQYLAVTRATQGYQGYMGPGWYGHVMLPLDHAFDHEDGRYVEAAIPESALGAVMGNPRLFSEALRGIPGQAAKIQRALNRSVWNGNVSQKGDSKTLNPAFSKILLWEISNTGLKTQDVFDQSINNLHQTVVSSILQDSQFQAALAIDIMDRNLYERANDCRWWALSPVFRRALSGTQDSAALSGVADTLVHINSLYTVYDNLVVFDRNARALAVSNPKYQDICGQVLNEEWVRRTLSLGNSQSYAVSDFVPSPLYQGRPSYIYAAAIRDQSAAQNIVGGIGIVFDSAPQFLAMLNDALPHDENAAVPAGCFGVFANRERRIIASTLDTLLPGMQLELEDTFFRIGNGDRKSGIAVFNGNYYAVGACMSKGYREYKGAGDAYRNDVVALIFVPLGECRQDDRRGSASARARLQSSEMKAAGGGDCMEIATFYVDSHWLGIPTDHVVESIDISGLTRVPGAGENMLGYIMFRDKLISVVGLWGMLGKDDKRRGSGEPQIVVLRLDDANQTLIGIMVDELGEIPEIPLERIEKVSPMLSAGNALAESLVKPGAGKSSREMIVLLSPERLRQKFSHASA